MAMERMRQFLLAGAVIVAATPSMAWAAGPQPNVEVRFSREALAAYVRASDQPSRDASPSQTGAPVTRKKERILAIDARR